MTTGTRESFGITFDFQGRVALVTGASRGIGARVAELLGRSNARVLINYFEHGEQAEQVAAAIRQAGGEARVFHADVSEPVEVAALFAHLQELWGEMHFLVNNAGARFDAITHSITDEKWEQCQRVNLRSVFLVTREALKMMTSSRFGRIVSVSSIAGTIGSFGQSNYAAAKAGISALMKSIALEYGPKNIRANTVIPGIIETDMTADMKGDFKESVLAQIPLRRFGHPEEVAYPICFLLTEAASYINGATIHINGGGLRL
ncbi:MAG: hypothetical protein B1H03_06685 [Planctomycetales bacterium 4484_113]|nr:MAG: hypothetical protein B1H03_06685 [Planctomycetales bacterium 4484_113]